MNKELKELVDDGAEKYAETQKNYLCIECASASTIKSNFRKGAQFIYKHMTKPSGDDEADARRLSEENSTSDDHGGGLEEGYLAACAAKNAVIAARDAEIAELRQLIEDASVFMKLKELCCVGGVEEWLSRKERLLK